MSIVDDFDSKWFNSHENLFLFAEWLRENRGWEYCKQNLLDVLETPWSWEKEWRLASGDVHFTIVLPERDEEFTTDGTSCAWCDAQVGYVSWVSEGSEEIDWFPAYRDESTGDLACDDCAGTARNFTETVGAMAVAS